MTTTHTPPRPKSLRELLAGPGLVVAQAAYDAIGARLIEQAGFDAVYMTGAGTSLARGYPDFGLLTQTEMAENAGVMARSVGIPLVADADTGYGNELNITRTVREYEARGVAAIHLEDQVSPKRCGHLDGKEVVPRAEFLSKIRAAVEARRSHKFLIIARTDARAVLGLDEAIDRANAALDVGADIAFVEAMQTREEVELVPRRVRGACLLNIVAGGRTPVLDTAEAEAMGYKLALVPGLLVSAMIEAGDAALTALKSSRVVPSVAASVGETFRRFGADDWDRLRRRFNAGAEAIHGDAPMVGVHTFPRGNAQ
ncbi:isocitrate lyase/PEP mutase family protein [Mitsuaria sp. CC2]|uniref:isocitrate lyase/PEP mutase family protein n=1 Tax=Mitsuaria sp. CC2 TaxID=3029186 RepID=UPI003B8E5F9D